MQKVDSSDEAANVTNRVLWHDPVGLDGFDKSIKDMPGQAKRPDRASRCCIPERDLMYLECYYRDVSVLTDVSHEKKQEENEEYEAAAIGCLYHPEVREITEDSVVSARAEASLHIEAGLEYGYAIIRDEKMRIPKMHKHVAYGAFVEWWAVLTYIDMGVHAFPDSPLRQQTA